MKRLPIGIQSFEVLRGQGYLYVDKTEWVYRLVDEGMFYFLARPRRFGKSLLVSTLKCLFQGRRELFEGLWIAEHGDWEWQEHPVVVIDFNEIAVETPEALESSLFSHLDEIAVANGLSLSAKYLGLRLRELILALARKSGKPVVVLVDEYDKPLISHLGRGEEELQVAVANRDLLKSFFGVLKDASAFRVLHGGIAVQQGFDILGVEQLVQHLDGAAVRGHAGVHARGGGGLLCGAHRAVE